MNPFDKIDEQFMEVKKQLEEINALLKNHHLGQDADFIPVSSIVPKVIPSRTFYDYVRAGKITIYKVKGGKKSFVKRSEYLEAFRPVPV